MNKKLIYLEMSDAQRELSHIFDCLEYAHCLINVGINGVPCNATIKEVNALQNKASDSMESAMEAIEKLMNAYTEQE